MSSKSKKTLPGGPTTSTPVGRSSSRPASSTERPTSPLSPTRHSRLQEKNDLQNLNDRLAAYIDKVRYLENENSGLRREIQTTEEVVTREISSVKNLYEHELNDARRLLDDTCREKTKLELDLKRISDENIDLIQRLDKKTTECANAEGSARMYEQRCSDLNSKYNSAHADRKKAEDDAKDKAKEIDHLRKQLKDIRANLEREMQLRIEAENAMQSLREELSFKEQLFEQELMETRTRRQVEISEIDGTLAQQYETKLQQSLQELREQQEANVRANREEIEAMYEAKLNNLQAAANRNMSAANLAVEELRSIRTRNDTLNGQLAKLENSNAQLNNAIRELERQMQEGRARHAEDLAALEAELARMREDMANQLIEYTNLMDIKISLDREIATYRKLLESEEDRLNLSQVASETASSTTASTTRITPARRGTPLRANRKRTLLDESEERSATDFTITSSSKGDVEISDVCPQGTFVTIHNKSSKEVSLAGYQILRECDSGETTTFKFHRSVKLEPGTSATVWSSDAGREHEPPHSIVMKGQKWFVSDNFATKVINQQQEEVATSERQKRVVSSSAQRHRELFHKYPRREDEIREDPENCKIM